MDERKERLTREAIGGMNVPFPEGVIRDITAVALVLLVAVAVTPARENRQVLAGSPVDARMVSPAPEGSAARPAEASAEGNVVDLTY